MKKTNNHELYHKCPNCGHEFNFWEHGSNCPNCTQPQTVGELFQRMQRQKLLKREASIQAFN